MTDTLRQETPNGVTEGRLAFMEEEVQRLSARLEVVTKTVDCLLNALQLGADARGTFDGGLQSTAGTDSGARPGRPAPSQTPAAPQLEVSRLEVSRPEVSRPEVSRPMDRGYGGGVGWSNEPSRPPPESVRELARPESLPGPSREPSDLLRTLPSVASSVPAEAVGVYATRLAAKCEEWLRGHRQMMPRAEELKDFLRRNTLLAEVTSLSGYWVIRLDGMPQTHGFVVPSLSKVVTETTTYLDSFFSVSFDAPPTSLRSWVLVRAAYWRDLGELPAITGTVDKGHIKLRPS